MHAAHRFWSYDGSAIATHATEAEARSVCVKALNEEREQAGDGWTEAISNILWGEVRERVVESKRITLAEAEAAGDETIAEALRHQGVHYACDYALQAIPSQLEEVSDALGAYPDSDLVSLATTLSAHAEALDAVRDALLAVPPVSGGTLADQVRAALIEAPRRAAGDVRKGVVAYLRREARVLGAEPHAAHAMLRCALFIEAEEMDDMRPPRGLPGSDESESTAVYRSIEDFVFGPFGAAAQGLVGAWKTAARIAHDRNDEEGRTEPVSTIQVDVCARTPGGKTDRDPLVEHLSSDADPDSAAALLLRQLFRFPGSTFTGRLRVIFREPGDGPHLYSFQRAIEGEIVAGRGP